MSKIQYYARLATVVSVTVASVIGSIAVVMAGGWTMILLFVTVPLAVIGFDTIRNCKY